MVKTIKSLCLLTLPKKPEKKAAKRAKFRLLVADRFPHRVRLKDTVDAGSYVSNSLPISRSLAEPDIQAHGCLGTIVLSSFHAFGVSMGLSLGTFPNCQPYAAHTWDIQQ